MPGHSTGQVSATLSPLSSTVGWASPLGPKLPLCLPVVGEGFISPRGFRRCQGLSYSLESPKIFLSSISTAPQVAACWGQSWGSGGWGPILSLCATRPDRSRSCSPLHRMRRMGPMNTRSLGSHALERQRRFNDDPIPQAGGLRLSSQKLFARAPRGSAAKPGLEFLSRTLIFRYLLGTTRGWRPPHGQHRCRAAPPSQKVPSDGAGSDGTYVRVSPPRLDGSAPGRSPREPSSGTVRGDSSGVYKSRSVSWQKPLPPRRVLGLSFRLGTTVMAHEVCVGSSGGPHPTDGGGGRS